MKEYKNMVMHFVFLSIVGDGDGGDIDFGDGGSDDEGKGECGYASNKNVRGKKWK